MVQRQLLDFGEIVAMNAYLFPDKLGARDLTRSLNLSPVERSVLQARQRACRTGAPEGRSDRGPRLQLP